MQSKTAQNKERTKTAGFWHETLPDGSRVVCFKVISHGKKFVQKLKLPKGVEQLQAV